jgi:hypothetical protein
MTSKNAPQKVKDTPIVSVDLEDEFDSHAGAGVSKEARDNLIQTIKILQPLSPEVLEGYGAAGNFYMRGEEDPAAQELLFQPCGMSDAWFEFVPREAGSGFVARYPVNGYRRDGTPLPPPGAEYVDGYHVVFEDSGNNCIHYRLVPGLVWKDGHPKEYVLSFYSTGHTIARQWNSKWLHKFTKSGKIAPACSHVYRLTTIKKSNKKGTWYVIETDAGTPINASEAISDPKLAASLGLSLTDAWERGAKVSKMDTFDAAEE